MAGAGVAVVARGLCHTYRTDDGPLRVLDGLDVEIPAAGYAAVTGRSGSGKSTFLSLLGGLEHPQEGSLVVGDVDLAHLAGDALAAYRQRTVGFVFQHFGLLETLTATENVELALSLSGRRRRDRTTAARTLLDAVGLAHRLDHRPLALSGGERQRVAIARALANDPALLLADEPTGNLDEDAAAVIVDLLEAIARDKGATLVVVTHNRALAARAGVHLSLAAGRLVAT